MSGTSAPGDVPAPVPASGSGSGSGSGSEVIVRSAAAGRVRLMVPWLRARPAAPGSSMSGSRICRDSERCVSFRVPVR